MDFGALPPEINSGRMYSGAGSGPMLAAAAAWDKLEADLSYVSAGYGSVISELTSGSWWGPTAASMAAAASPYVAWLSATAEQVGQTATQARAAVAAYEAAFAMTVPPPVIEANRALLMTLITTNFFGQNTSAIAATEALYAEMWGQDATAMYHYAATSTAATKVTPFTPPAATTQPAGLSGQAAAVAAAGNTQPALSTSPTLVPSISSALHSLASGTPSGSSGSGLLDFWSQYQSAILRYEMTPYFFGGLGHFFSGIGNMLMPAAKAAAGALPAAARSLAGITTLPGLGSSAVPVSASLGYAGAVGGLSVPSSWASATPTLTGSTLPFGNDTAAAGGPASSMLRGIPAMGGVGRRASGGFANRYGFRLSVIQRPPAAG